MKKAETPEPLYRISLPPEDHHKVSVSRYYIAVPNDARLISYGPYYRKCNVRIDFDLEGKIYKVEWQNS